ncbi:MAG: 50S ribosomal protein L6 [Planctomycetaceae bacterium]
MSRVGNKPVVFPGEVTVGLDGQTLSVKGPQGALTLDVHPGVGVSVDQAERRIVVTRPDDQRESRALHGLTRSLINNMVTGVVKPFERSLIIVGVGYNAALSGNKPSLRVGYANTIELEVPAGVTCECSSNVRVVAFEGLINRRSDSSRRIFAASVLRSHTKVRVFATKTSLFVGSPGRPLVQSSAGGAFRQLDLI